MEISIQKSQALKQKPADESNLSFGKTFTDHMFLMNYDEGQGWHDPRIVPFGPISLSPAAMCLHYGQEVFEGLKAYRTAQGKIQLFRPEANMARLNHSNERICIPLINEELAVRAVKTLVELDKEWVPHAPGTSLYIRPYIFAVDEMLGVQPAKHLIFAIILCPVGAYYAGGLNPVRIYVENKYVRAVVGGTGHTKTAGNYASSLKSQSEAQQSGYQQVLWLDGIERRYIEEVGAMNVFFVIDDEIVTPELTGSILPGITRHSAIELLRSWGLTVNERRVSIEEIESAAGEGRLREMFGTGTAAVVSSVGELRIGERSIVIGDNKIGTLTQKLYNTLTGIQWGTIPDTFGWIQPVC